MFRWKKLKESSFVLTRMTRSRRKSDQFNQNSPICSSTGTAFNPQHHTTIPRRRRRALLPQERCYYNGEIKAEANCPRCSNKMNIVFSNRGGGSYRALNLCPNCRTAFYFRPHKLVPLQGTFLEIPPPPSVNGNGTALPSPPFPPGLNLTRPSLNNPWGGSNLPTPKQITKGLDQFVIGQHTPKKVLSVAVYNHYKRIYHAALHKRSSENAEVESDHNDLVELEKTNVLLVGPTGSGKTLLAKTLARFVNVPFVIADATTLTQVESGDLIAYGLVPEFIGRFPVLVSLSALNEDQLVQVLTEPKNALGRQYKKMFSMNNVKLHFTDNALRLIAKKAMAKNTGARGLRAILESILTEAMYEIPDLKTGKDRVDAVVVDEQSIGSLSKPGCGAKILRGDGALENYLSKTKSKDSVVFAAREPCWGREECSWQIQSENGVFQGKRSRFPESNTDQVEVRVSEHRPGQNSSQREPKYKFPRDGPGPGLGLRTRTVLYQFPEKSKVQETPEADTDLSLVRVQTTRNVTNEANKFQIC